MAHAHGRAAARAIAVVAIVVLVVAARSNRFALIVETVCTATRAPQVALDGVILVRALGKLHKIDDRARHGVFGKVCGRVGRSGDAGSGRLERGGDNGIVNGRVCIDSVSKHVMHVASVAQIATAPLPVILERVFAARRVGRQRRRWRRRC